MDTSISGLQQQHLEDLEKLTLVTQPFRTLKLFILAIVQSLKGLAAYLLAKGGLLMLLSISAAALAILLLVLDGSHSKHFEELYRYIQFGLWWIALGVASSIGLGSGLHTFVLYLGPHVALFTIKAMQCGRIDLKSAPYDTIRLKTGPSWLDKECSEFGPPLFELMNGVRVPLFSILPQVQVEAVLWGIGTALGELPPYFISRAARLSGNDLETMEQLNDSSSKDGGIISSHLRQIQNWFLSHSEHLNFRTILALASVPNPLFDLAGIMCGQFGVPFWKFFLATVIGKAIIKTHIQTIFIISVSNNQLLHWVENKLIWVLSFVPGLAPFLPSMVNRLNAVRNKYLTGPSPANSNTKVKKWDLSLASIWNTVVWLMLINFFSKIVTATAQKYLKEQQQKEIDRLNKLHPQAVSTQ
ncbi:vacuole membrane protein KMS1-like [Punica granatum]|uniref:Vacuole membrane protein KMS1-like n=1 Tax=Punica granatum TaxID=22663 RepID=A0A6P8DMR5_PUNGR|nr:vacuole membrane protein KMS1-like [Punica granatum]